MEENIIMVPGSGTKVIERDVKKEIEAAFLDYSMSVIVSRALPDVRDGLKPVHRRILYTMHERGNDPQHPYRKSADTVGAVLGSYHPHGDASVYDAMVRLAQDFSLRYPLVDGQGNFGSVDGDPPAAYRYTEARMSKIACEMLTDIEKETIDWDPNFDETKKEPHVLPSRFPNLLVNGSQGIAVGMATNIPPHNLREVVAGMTALIDDPDIDLAGLMEYINTPLPESDEIPLHDLEKALSEVEKELGITLASKQREAVLTALTHKMCIITGGPGTGKTTILVAILRLYHIFCNQRGVLLLAPTGKAARRMSESTGEQAYTIHRGLGLTPREGEEDLIRSGHSMMSDETGFLCIDEGSMVDNVLMSAIVEKLPMGSRFLCIGDTDQLPSIGAGAILKDLIDSDCIPVVRLDVIYRQSETSSIVKNAQAIRAGDTHLNFDGSFSLKTVGQPMKGAGSQADLPTHEQVVRTYLELVKQYGIKEVAILCPRRTKILLSSEQINQSVQSSMFQNAPGTPRVTIGNRTFYVGDRIVQCKNTDTASNGDMGVIREIRPANGDDPEKVIINFDFDEGSSVAYDHEDMKNVQLGYALTVHRSQGSEFKVVLIPLSWSQAIVLYRNLIYTAITRGKEKVLLFGQKAVLDYAIRRKNQTQRNTNLDHFLQNEKRSRKII